MSAYKTVPRVTSCVELSEKFITMREELLDGQVKKFMGYPKDCIAKRKELMFNEDYPMEVKMEIFKSELFINVKLGLKFTGDNIMPGHVNQISWTDESIINFLDNVVKGKKLMGLEIGYNKPDYKNKVGIPVGLYRLQMLSCCLNRSDLMTNTHYNGEVVNKWVQKNKSKFIGKCLGALTKDEYENLCDNA